MTPDNLLPDTANLPQLLQQIAPGAVRLELSPLPSSYSNFTCLLHTETAAGDVRRFALRRYAIFGSYDRGEKARREFKTLQLLHANGIPAPLPVYLDDSGSLLGSPGIVTLYVPGALIFTPEDPIAWAQKLAAALARVHAISCDAANRDFLLDANSEATWFIRGGQAPAAMRVHAEGMHVWQTVNDMWPRLHLSPPALVHLDYWSGNILWHQAEIAGIVDWEEAACGDPGIDIGYARMDMVLLGLPEAAAAFLAAYEAIRGEPVANLGFWELAAAARPMFNPVGWIAEPPASDRFHQFVTAARQRAAAA